MFSRFFCYMISCIIVGSRYQKSNGEFFKGGVWDYLRPINHSHLIYRVAHFDITVTVLYWGLNPRIPAFDISKLCLLNH
jgi:hypothetical protein